MVASFPAIAFEEPIDDVLGVRVFVIDGGEGGNLRAPDRRQNVSAAKGRGRHPSEKPSARAVHGANVDFRFSIFDFRFSNAVWQRSTQRSIRRRAASRSEQFRSGLVPLWAASAD